MRIIEGAGGGADSSSGEMLWAEERFAPVLMRWFEQMDGRKQPGCPQPISGIHRISGNKAPLFYQL